MNRMPHKGSVSQSAQSILDSSSSAVSSVLKEEPVFAPNASRFGAGLKQPVDAKLLPNSTARQSRNQMVIPEEKEANGLSKLPEESNASLKLPAETSVASPDAKSRKERLRTLFWRYSKISDETGAVCLSMRQYVKLLQDSEVIDGLKVGKSKAEVVFASAAGRKGMNFEAFFKSLVKIAEIKYKNLYSESELKALEEIVAKHLLPLYRSVLNESSLPVKTLVPFEEVVYDATIKAMMNSILPVLREIYSLYFEELFKKVKTNEQRLQISSKQVFAFARDFELFSNGLVSKPIVFSMLDTLMNTSEDKLTNNFGDSKIFYTENNTESTNHFTLGRFLIFLFWTAVCGFQDTKYEEVQCTSAERLYLLLAKMEVSKGFTELSKKCFKHHSLLPTSEYIRKDIADNPLSYQTHSTARTTEESKKPLRQDHNLESFKRLFVANASLNVDSNISKMTCFKLISLLKDSGLVKSKSGLLSTMDIHLLFTKALYFNGEKQRGNAGKEAKQDKLDFKRFYWLVTQIATKVYPSTAVTESLGLLYDNVSL
eukprot:TRINITY_DN2617_c0_g4_i5.p1 TRINITY_DN2617_c0_g4~~TRINITY_DN2617_c0_g4_i5.p1  ORF type:complete len:542 (-),score=126.93 TRINITY_DN2617_c0_g4_i5:592-2217(-)